MNSQTTNRENSRGQGILVRLLIIAIALLVTTLISQVRASAQIVVKGTSSSTGRSRTRRRA